LVERRKRKLLLYVLPHRFLPEEAVVEEEEGQGQD